MVLDQLVRLTGAAPTATARTRLATSKRAPRGQGHRPRVGLRRPVEGHARGDRRRHVRGRAGRRRDHDLFHVSPECGVILVET